MKSKSSFITSFFTLLQKERVDYFVFGSYHNLPADTGNSDIDIVVSEDGLSKIESIFQSLTKTSGVILASYYENYNTKFFRILGTNWGVQIDIFYKGLCYQGCPYFPIDALKPYVKNHNEIVRVIEQQNGYFVDYFKEVIHNGTVKEKYIDAVINSFTNDRKLCENSISEIYGNRVLDLIASNLSQDGLKRIARPLQKELQKVILHGNSFRVLLFKLKNLLRLFQKRPGYVIVVEGTDGSGKSYIINSITPILNESFHNGIIYNHLRPHCLPDIAELFGKRKKAANISNHVVTDPHAEKPSGVLGSLVRWSYYMIDYTFGYLRKVWLPIHSKSKVFIFDRYYYEYYLDQRRSHVNLPIWIIRLGEFFIPKPDLILCLGGDPEKIYARKPETSLQEVTRQTKVLKDFCSIRKNAAWIDTTITPEESINAAMKAIIKMMSKRFDINDLK